MPALHARKSPSSLALQRTRTTRWAWRFPPWGRRHPRCRRRGHRPMGNPNRPLLSSHGPHSEIALVQHLLVESRAIGALDEVNAAVSINVGTAGRGHVDAVRRASHVVVTRLWWHRGSRGLGRRRGGRVARCHRELQSPGRRRGGRVAELGPSPRWPSCSLSSRVAEATAPLLTGRDTNSHLCGHPKGACRETHAADDVGLSAHVAEAGPGRLGLVGGRERDMRLVRSGLNGQVITHWLPGLLRKKAAPRTHHPFTLSIHARSCRRRAQGRPCVPGELQA